GIFQALAGLVAIVDNEFYIATGNYLFQFDATTWGWIHLLLGLLVGFAGWGLLSGRTWARVVGITVAVLSAIAAFLWLPYYPLWALLIIALDVFVIWAIAAHGREVAVSPQLRRGSGWHDRHRRWRTAPGRPRQRSAAAQRRHLRHDRRLGGARRRGRPPANGAAGGDGADDPAGVLGGRRLCRPARRGPRRSSADAGAG